ncbi:MAG: site-2 protease family protein [Anaerolineae bacterium]|nr:site-2 protease family protein [Anaerolineae bacterium]
MIGFLMFLIIGFGFLGQAPVNAYRMRNPRLGMTLAVAAGPLSNLLTALVFAIPWWLGLFNPQQLFTSVLTSQYVPSLSEVGYYIIFWNVLLCFFNLLPFYPLDGWTIVLGLLPTDLAYTWERYRTQSYYLFFILIILSILPIPGVPNIFGLLISQPTNAVVGFLTRLG